MQNENFNVEVHNKHEYKNYNAKNGDRILAEIVRRTIGIIAKLLFFFLIDHISNVTKLFETWY